MYGGQGIGVPAPVIHQHPTLMGLGNQDQQCFPQHGMAVHRRIDVDEVEGADRQQAMEAPVIAEQAAEFAPAPAFARNPADFQVDLVSVEVAAQGAVVVCDAAGQ